MRQSKDIHITIGDKITPEELWQFYKDNNCCEARLGFEKATCVLRRSDIVIVARDTTKVVGVARAVFDGVDALICELSVAVEYQGQGAKHQTASLVEDDALDIGKKLGQALVKRLLAKGALFIEMGAVWETEIPFYKSLGFIVNKGHVPMYIDRRADNVV